MAVSFVLNGIDRTNYVHQTSGVSINWTLGGIGSCSFTLVILGATWRPTFGQAFTWYEDGTAIFSGTLETVEEEGIPGNPSIFVRCNGFSLEQRLASRMIVPLNAGGGGSQSAFENKTAKQIITDLMANYGAGEHITVLPANLDDGATIDRIYWDHASVFDAISQLAQISDCVWWIDPDYLLHFKNRAGVSAPFVILDGQPHCQEMRVAKKREGFADYIYYRYNFAAVDYDQESYTADGVATSWNTTRQINRIEKITVGGEEKSVGTTETGGDDFYYHPGFKTIYQRAGDPPIAADSAIVVYYRPLGGDVYETSDGAVVSQRSAIEGGSGIWATLVEDSNNASADSVTAKAAQILARQKQLPIVLEIVTRETGLRVGQELTASYSLPQVPAGNYLVTELYASLIGVSADLSGTSGFRYTVTGVSGSGLIDGAAFFKGLGGYGTGSVVGAGGAPVDPGEQVQPPSQTTDANLSVDVVDFYSDVPGQQWANVHVSVANPPGDADYFEGWVIESPTEPTDPTIAEHWGVATRGNVIGKWMPRPKRGSNPTYWLYVTASKFSYRVLPTAATPKISFQIPERALAQQVTNASVSVVPDPANPANSRYRYEFDPPNDPEFWYAAIERIKCDSTYTPLPGEQWARVAGPPADPNNPTAHVVYDGELWPNPGVDEYWLDQFLSANNAEELNYTDPPIVQVYVPAATPGGVAVPGSPSITSGYHKYAADGTLDLYAQWEPGSPAGAGVHAYYEPYDQSTNETFTLDGTSPLDGTQQLAGDWAPVDAGKFTTSPVAIKGLPAVKHQTDVLVYLTAYSNQVDVPLVRKGEPNASPSIVITVPPPSAKGTPGREWAEPVFGWTVIPEERMIGGVKKTVFKCSFTRPEYRPPTGVYVYVKLPEWPEPKPLGIIIATGQEVWMDTPKPDMAQVWGVSFVDPSGTSDPGDDQVNSIVTGVTPMTTVAVGSSETVDAAQVLRDSIASHLSVVSGVLGVTPGSLTQDLVMQYTLGDRVMADLAVQARALGTGAVTGSKYANQSIPSAAIGYGVIWNAHFDRASANRVAMNYADIVSVSAGTVLAGALAAGVIYTGTVNANQINTGVISAHIKMTSPELVITNYPVTVNIDATNHIRVGNASFRAFCRIDGSQFRTESTAFPASYAALTWASLEMSSSDPNAWGARVSPSELLIAGLPGYYPGPGSKKFWYDPADGNRVKFAA